MKKTAIVLSLSTVLLLAESQVIDLTPISVVATGIEKSIVEQPLSIATKGEEEIKLDQVIFQKDLLNSLSGVHIEQTGSVIGHTTAIRMPENKSSYYLFMQDGIPVQSSGFFNHNGLAYTTFQTATSVEVLKGAGTALHGSDAVAAVIDVESLKKPSKNKEISIKGMAGSNGYGSGSVNMSDTIDEDSAYRASVGYMRSDGWRDHTTSDRFEANIRYDQTINNDNDVKISFKKVTDTIGLFERTLVTPSLYDDYLNGDDNAMTPAQKDGLKTFIDKGCVSCHNGVALGQSMNAMNITATYKYQNIGDFKGDKNGMVKVPTLRNITQTAPYFHNGQIWNLKEAIVEMGRIQLGMKITDKEATSIETFLKALDGRKPALVMPILPASTDKTPKPDVN